MSTEEADLPMMDDQTMSLFAQDARLSAVEQTVESLVIRMNAMEAKQRRVDKMLIDLQLENRRDNKMIENKLDMLLSALQPKVTVP